MTPSTVVTNPPRLRTGRPRTPVIAAVVAVIGFATEGVIALVHTTGDRHWDGASQVLNLAFVVACVALIVALPAVGRLLDAGRSARGGIAAAQLGFAAMVVESVVSGIHDGNTLGGVFFVGLIFALVGQLVLAIAGMRHRELRWAAPLPFLGLLVAIAGGDHGGSIVLAAVWVVLATIIAKTSVAGQGLQHRPSLESDTHRG